MRKITNPIVIGIVRRCKAITLLLTTCGSAARNTLSFSYKIVRKQMTTFITML